MDKQKLKEQILIKLNEQLSIAIESANAAHSTATHSESVAENKYDTFGLEASYLAHGQSERIDQLTLSIDTITAMSVRAFSEDDPVAAGAMISLEDSAGMLQHIFMAPSAGGIKVATENKTIVVVTPEAPLGAALMQKYIDDEISVGGKSDNIKTIIHIE